MIVPGSNLLALAMGPVARQTLQHRAFVSRAANAAGDFVSTFADPVDITGSFQAIDKAAYQQLGLDLSRNYSRLYTQADVRPLDRDRQGDVVLFAGKIWQCQDAHDWRSVDGWRRLLCVEVPNL